MTHDTEDNKNPTMFHGQLVNHAQAEDPGCTGDKDELARFMRADKAGNPVSDKFKNRLRERLWRVVRGKSRVTITRTGVMALDGDGSGRFDRSQAVAETDEKEADSE